MSKLKNFLLHFSLGKILSIIMVLVSTFLLTIDSETAYAATSNGFNQYFSQTSGELETLVAIGGLGIAFISLIVVKAELKNFN